MSNRVKISVRVHPETEQLGRKLARKYFQDERKFGLVIDEAINLFHASKTRPAEVESLLSSTEEYIIHNFNLQVSKAMERMGNLMAKGVYEMTLSRLMADKIGYRLHGNWHNEIEPQLRKEAAQSMKQKLEKEVAPGAADLAEQNTQLEAELEKVREENQKLTETIEKAKAYIQQAQETQTQQKQLQEQIDNQKRKIHDQKEELERLQTWTRGLITHMETGYSRMKGNDKLIQEYRQKNPTPKGV